MDFYSLLTMTHSGVAALLFVLAVCSVLTAVQIAVKPDSDRANSRLLNRANTIGVIENVAAILVTLTGLTVVLMGNWPFSQSWVWASLSIMTFYSVTVLAITKPPRMALADGGTAVKVGMQVLLHVAYLLLLVVTFALMLIKPA